MGGSGHLNGLEHVRRRQRCCSLIHERREAGRDWGVRGRDEAAALSQGGMLWTGEELSDKLRF